MSSYVIEFNGTGEVSEGVFDKDADAISWVESILESHGHNISDIVSGDWDADGENDNGNACERMLFWACEEDSVNDSGAKAVCKLCVVR